VHEDFAQLPALVQTCMPAATLLSAAPEMFDEEEDFDADAMDAAEEEVRV
jgi:hypothetical protein